MADFVDFHSHVLPGIDDGSQSVEESLEMLRAARAQGVRKLVASPHYYISEGSPDAFIERRNAAVMKLSGLISSDEYPAVYVGAEVLFSKVIAKTREIQKLTLSGTKCIMIEMPFRCWEADETEALISLGAVMGLKPILVHPERYLGYQKRGTAEMLMSRGIILQYNAEHFIEKKKASKDILCGRVRLLGSDMHNTSSRPPDLGELPGVLEKRKINSRFLEDVYGFSCSLLGNAAAINPENPNA